MCAGWVGLWHAGLCCEWRPVAPGGVRGTRSRRAGGTRGQSLFELRSAVPAQALGSRHDLWLDPAWDLARREGVEVPSHSEDRVRQCEGDKLTQRQRLCSMRLAHFFSASSAIVGTGMGIYRSQRPPKLADTRRTS